MTELCDLKVHINGHHTFFLNKTVVCSFSGTMKRMAKQEKKRSQVKGLGLQIMDFPGDHEGFELVTRFCYNNGRIAITASNLPLLHCSAIFLEMTEQVSSCNLLAQTETILDGLFYWAWSDVLIALKNCEAFIAIADAAGLVDKLISALLSKISASTSDVAVNRATAGAAGTGTPLPSSSSCSSSPDTFGFRCSLTKTPESAKLGSCAEWWFEDVAILAPAIIYKMMSMLGSYGSENKNLLLTRFLLHYLKAAAQRPGFCKELYGGLADTAVHGVVLMGRTAFSCRGLFWVLRVVSCLGLSKDCRQKLERLMGLMLDKATLDDLLVSGSSEGGVVYDVNLVLRLVRVFVSSEDYDVPSQSLKKVGKLIDSYLIEISPDQRLKVSKFLCLAESLPDCARDCYDAVYRALYIYLESHPTLSTEERTTLCRCLNYEKLTLEACKELAKNKRIPPGIAVQALALQKSKLQLGFNMKDRPDPEATPKRIVCRHEESDKDSTESSDEKEFLRLNLQRMQNRVLELEKVCRQMKGEMSRMARNSSRGSSCHRAGRGLPRLC